MALRLRIVYFFALLLTTLALIPVGAHLAELPHKITLPADQYFIVQKVYRGWAFFGFAIVGALIANFILAVMLRGRGMTFLLAAAAFLLLALGLTVYFLFTQPANTITDNWSVVPENWEQLRRQWEYSHAANAILSLGAFVALILSLLSLRD